MLSSVCSFFRKQTFFDYAQFNVRNVSYHFHCEAKFQSYTALLLEKPWYSLLKDSKRFCPIAYLEISEIIKQRLVKEFQDWKVRGQKEAALPQLQLLKSQKVQHLFNFCSCSQGAPPMIHKDKIAFLKKKGICCGYLKLGHMGKDCKVSFIIIRPILDAIFISFVSLICSIAMQHPLTKKVNPCKVWLYGRPCICLL